MLTVQVDPEPIQERHDLQLSKDVARRVLGHAHTHLVIERCGWSVRLDIEGRHTGSSLPALRFILADDDRLAVQTGVIAALLSRTANVRRHLALARQLYALHAAALSDGGVSLSQTAELVLGPGDWPGDGEHRKSKVRRLISAGKTLRITPITRLLRNPVGI